MNYYKHQLRFAETAPNKFLVAHSTGTGKTYTGLLVASQRTKSCMIVCPKGVKSKWANDIKNYPDTTFVVVTKEELRRDWTLLPKYEGIIIDECHHFSSIKSQLHKNLIKYIKKHNVQYVWGMTATPYRREPFNIFALAKIHGHDWNYITFRSIFYREQYFGRKCVWVPKKGVENDVANLIKKIGDVVSFEECADLPDIQHEIEYFEKTKEQVDAIFALESTEANPLTYYLREHQICSGVGAKTAKFDRILDLADTTPKLAVFCRYTGQIEAIKALLEENNHKVYVINGETKDKSKTAQDADNALKCVVIIQMDSAEGFELPSVNVIVFASMSYSYLSYVQSMGRFVRINKQNHPKLFIYLITSKSIDEDVYKNLLAKQDFDLAIYAKSRGKISN